MNMKLNIFGFVLCLIALIGCSGEVVSNADVENEDRTPQYELNKLIGIASFVSSNSYDAIDGGSEKYEVTLNELDSNGALTGREFSVYVTYPNIFKFENIKLQSPYAVLKVKNKKSVSGYGAFVNLSKVDTVYVNYMTNMEYKRIPYLMKKGMSSDSAEKTAQREIMEYLLSTSFDIKPSNQISGTEKDTELQAVWQMLSHIPYATYSSLEAADTAVYWMLETDSAKIDTFKMKYVDYLEMKFISTTDTTVNPIAAKVSSDLFSRKCGLGECSSANDGEAKKVPNSRCNAYDKPYVCKKDIGWTYPGLTFQETFGWEPGYDGEMRSGNYTEIFIYTYDSLQGKWISGAKDGCLTSNLGEVRKRETQYSYQSPYEVCVLDNNYFHWTSSTEEEYIAYGTRGQECDTLGLVHKLSNDSTYEVVCVEGKFRKATDTDKVVSVLEKEKLANPCGEKEEVRRGKTDSTVYFYCNNGEMGYSNEMEFTLGFGCNANHKGYFRYQNSIYNCNEFVWKYATDSLVKDVIVDSRDASQYKTIGIGNQVWMAENLNYEVDPSWCYGDTLEYCKKYGRLYQWDAILGANAKVKNVCPDGFHVPSNKEWDELNAFVDSWFHGNSYSVRSTLLSSDPMEFDNIVHVGKDLVGFTGIYVGHRTEGGYFTGRLTSAYFCSADKNEEGSAYIYMLRQDDFNLSKYAQKTNSTCNVRCVKD